MPVSENYKAGYRDGYNDAVYATNLNNLKNGSNDYIDGYHHGFGDGEYESNDWYLELDDYN